MLLNGEWAKKYVCCIECKTTKIRHKARGLCQYCYPFVYKKLNSEKIKEYNKNYFQKIKKENPKLIKERRDKWNKENPEKAKRIKKRAEEKRNKRILLKDGRWAEKYDRCIGCGTREKRHYVHGLCQSCYQKQQRKMFPEKTKKFDLKKKKYFKKNYTRRKGGIYQYLLDELNKELEKEKKEKEMKIYKAKRRVANAEKRKKRTLIKSKIKKRNYIRNRRRADIRFRLKGNISKAIIKKLKKRLSSKKGKSTFTFLPYTIEDLIQHLESLFQLGMTWKNYGPRGWHIDHKRPDCSFNYKSVDDKEFQECWALKNLQPLWAEENEKKGGRY